MGTQTTEQTTGTGLVVEVGGTSNWRYDKTVLGIRITPPTDMNLLNIELMDDEVAEDNMVTIYLKNSDFEYLIRDDSGGNILCPTKSSDSAGDSTNGGGVGFFYITREIIKQAIGNYLGGDPLVTDVENIYKTISKLTLYYPFVIFGEKIISNDHEETVEFSFEGLNSLQIEYSDGSGDDNAPELPNYAISNKLYTTDFR